jgi:hypothetical protein
MINTDDCWIYAGYKNHQGYGMLGYRLDGVLNREMAHRIAYRSWVTTYPEDYEIDHLCRNQTCINPLHLEAVTKLENIRRQWAALGNACKRGHSYIEGSYRTVKASKNGKTHEARVCKVCIKLKLKERTNA